jgi:glycosyltransferase involved in cell wall biosynthesis
VTSSFHTNFHSYSRLYGMGLLKTPIDGYLRKLHNRTLATMVPTQAMMDELLSRGYHNVTLLSRGVEIEQFTPERRSQALRKAWGAGPEDLVVLLVGRLAKEKNVNLLLAAYQAIVAKHPSAKLVLVGDGPLRKQLQEACPTAIFAGVKKNLELATHYASADLFIFPSLTETFGNVVPEALASGLAVLSYANAAAKELIEHGKNGLLVAPGEEIQFVHAAVELAGNTTLQTRLRQSAPQSVAHLGWNAIYDSFIQTLHAVLIRHGHSFADPPGQAATAAISLPNA